MPGRQRTWAYAAVVIAIVLSVMDASVANVALPTIGRDLHATPAASILTVSAYQLAIVISLLPLSSLGDIYGYRRIYLGGIVVFTIASLGCAFSNSIDALIAARAIQGFGASGIMSVNVALIRYIFPQNRLGRAISYNALAISLSSTIGPSFASVVLSFATWPWLFAVNIPLGILGFCIGIRSLPWSIQSNHRFDLLSAVLTATTFGLLVISINSVSRGAPPWALVAQVFVGALAGFWMVRRQRFVPAPLLPVDLLRVPLLALSVGTSICAFISQMLAFVALPFYMQSNLGLRVTTIGFLIMPWPLAVAAVAPVIGRLADRYQPAILSSIGLALLAIGFIMLASLSRHAGIADIAWRMALCGAGFAMFQTPNNRTIVSAAPKARSGAAGGIIGTSRLLGQATGAALVALMLAQMPRTGGRDSILLASGFAGAASIVSIFRKSNAN